MLQHGTKKTEFTSSDAIGAVRMVLWDQGVATRYDKTARSFMAFLALAAVRVWLPSFVAMVQEP